MEKARLMLVLGIAFAVLTAFFCWCYTKKSPKVEKWGWRVIGLLAAGFAVFTVWYYTPVSCRQTVTVQTYEAKTMDVELDLTIHRSYLHGTRVEGTGRTPNGYYPRNFGNERSGVTLTPGDRRLRASLFNEEGGTFESCLMLTAEFSWDWKTIRWLTLWEIPLKGETTYYTLVN